LVGFASAVSDYDSAEAPAWLSSACFGSAAGSICSPLAAVSATLTAWLLASSRIPRGADQAVVALMARHILAGRTT